MAEEIALPHVTDQDLLQPEPRLWLDLSAVEKLNLADFQNSVPALRELVVVNDTEQVFSQLRLTVSSEPAFLHPRIWRIDRLDAGASCRISDTDLRLDGALLARLTESEKATLLFRLEAGCDEQPDCLLEHGQVVELLPRQHWGGLGQLPEMVAAFVQPNDPAVDRLLGQAAEVLRKHGKPSAINGYQEGSRRVWELVAAIWSALQSCQIKYALPPASFEMAGQKVRSPGQILDSRVATCLDSTLLLAAVMEQASLHPLLIFTRGHAFVGVWLKQETFSAAAVDDITALRKRLQLGELLVFETTLLTNDSPVRFSQACEVGKDRLSEEKQAEFELVVDVARARRARIRPLANESAADKVADASVTLAGAGISVLEDAPDLPADADWEPDSTANLSPEDRLARWQRKLLDLSLRNTLLNFKVGKKSLPLIAPDPARLEDLLAGGDTIKLFPAPDLMTGADPRSLALHQAREQEDVWRQQALEALPRKEVLIRLDEQDLSGRLVELYRGARAALQEGGANTLFLAMGFLVWSREGKQEQSYRAPLVLLPVVLERRNARSGFTLKQHDDGPRFNPTLIEMLRQDFQLDLGIRDGGLPTDDAGLDLRKIWLTVAAAVKNIPGWEVQEEVVLSTFSFAKYLMWKDLAEQTEQLRQSPVVRHLIDTPREAYPSGVAFPEPRRLDQEFSPAQTFCPLPADSSQLAAVMAAARGKDFVLIGPPGTGKSQTIANLIAQCLAEGKRVLFVAEKIAALDVVHRRLREVGIGEFCLELHSSKASKQEVMGQIKRALDGQAACDQAEWQRQADALAQARAELSRYVDRLHRRHRNGLTVFKALGSVVAGEKVPVVRLGWLSADQHDHLALQQLSELVEQLATHAGLVTLRSDSPLQAIQNTQFSLEWKQSLDDAIARVGQVAGLLPQVSQRFCQAAGLPLLGQEGSRLQVQIRLAQLLPALLQRNWQFLLKPDAGDVLSSLRQGLELAARLQRLNARLPEPWAVAQQEALQRGLELLQQRDQSQAQLGKPLPMTLLADLQDALRCLEQMQVLSGLLSVKYSPAVEGLPVHQLLRDWTKASQSLWPLSLAGQRKVRAVLESLVEGASTPDIAADLPLLSELQGLREQIQQKEIPTDLIEVWRGVRTRPGHLAAVLGASDALSAFLKGEAWADRGLEAAAEGVCGEQWAAVVQALRTIRRLDLQLGQLQELAAASDGLWCGLQTDRSHLQQALAFMQEYRALARGGAMQSVYPQVAAGDCGARLRQMHELLSQRAAVEAELGKLDVLSGKTAGLWQGTGTTAEAVNGAQACHAALNETLIAISDKEPVQAALCQRIGAQLGDVAARDQLLQIAPKLEKVVAAWEAAIAELCRLLGAGGEQVAEWRAIPVAEVVARIQGLQVGIPEVRNWCGWQKARKAVVAAGLQSLVDALERGELAGHALRTVFEVNYSRWWLQKVVDQDEVLSGFVSAEQERRIARFQQLDDQFTQLTCSWIRSRIRAGIPAADQLEKGGEWGILQRELAKKARHLPLRELMGRAPGAIRQLMPCLLMSPLSIAQYLGTGHEQFDVVIFDEASQITVWDAIGAMARGRQVVMVGDPKQLPPTRFFDRAETDQDDEDVEPDMESILDECMAASMPTCNLRWHYRSRHESLITFSNHRYYGGDLVTFPSPFTDDRAVSFHHVANGLYAKGGARTNQPEARALVDDLVQLLRSPQFRAERQTVGIVTFNSQQQTLIEDLLDDARRSYPEIEDYFAEDATESVFVKNLESVQGDERDIIYFSITFGPDLSGAVSMNFGPMNKDGGERRLNVAVTRARHAMRIFSSLRADQIDLSRTRARGVRDLKHFLDFAERGVRALAEANQGSVGEFESPFEQAVAEALQSKGWVVQSQIGVSAFRVDLGVVHPDAPGCYLAGVECDGATYHRTATARDRDKLREQVLRGLGWEILRIWSTDWWLDQRSILQRIDQQLQELLQRSRAQRAEAERAAAAEEEARQQALAAQAEQDLQRAAEVIEPAGSPEPERVSPLFADNRLPLAQSELPGMADSLTQYREVDPLEVGEPVQQEAFYDPASDARLLNMIAHLVNHEGPILGAVLARRIARAHGFQRTGGRIQERVEALAARHFRSTTEPAGSFYWPQSLKPGSPVGFRSAGADVRRVLEEICQQELQSLAASVRARAASDEAALQMMAAALGISRMREATRGQLLGLLAMSPT